MRFKPLSYMVLASAIATSSIGSSTTALASESNQTDKIEQQKKGDVAKPETDKNTSKSIDFNKAKNMSPKERKAQLTKDDKKLHDKDIEHEEKGSRELSKESGSKNSSSLRSATNAPSQDINKYIETNNIKHAPIKEDSRIGNLPKYNYKSGKYVGVVVHDTANDNSNINGEVNYMYNNYKNAFVHAYVNSNEIRQTAPADYLAWGAGANANPYFYQIELVHAHSINEFAKSVNNDAYLTAYMLKRNGLKPKLADNNGGDGTVISHNAVSKYYGGSNHTDPVSYFNRWGYDMNQYFALVQKHYKTLTGKPSESGKTNPENLKTHTVKKGETLYRIATSNNMSVDKLKKLNNLKSNTLKVGQKLKLTDDKPSQYTVKKGDTLYRIAISNKMTVNQLKKLNGLKSDSLKVGQKLKLK